MHASWPSRLRVRTEALQRLLPRLIRLGGSEGPGVSKLACHSSACWLSRRKLLHQQETHFSQKTERQNQREGTTGRWWLSGSISNAKGWKEDPNATSGQSFLTQRCHHALVSSTQRQESHQHQSTAWPKAPSTQMSFWFQTGKWCIHPEETPDALK